MVEMEKTIPLLVPVTMGGETYTQITIRRPKGNDLLLIDRHLQTPMAGMLAMIDACIKDVPAGFAGQMDEADIDEAQEVLDRFRPKRQKTGSSGSE